MVGRRDRRQRRRRTAAVAGVAAHVVSKHSDTDAPEEPAQETIQEPVQETPITTEPTDAEKLENLAQLKEQGILTEEEFTAKKAQILGL